MALRDDIDTLRLVARVTRITNPIILGLLDSAQKIADLEQITKQVEPGQQVRVNTPDFDLGQDWEFTGFTARRRVKGEKRADQGPDDGDPKTTIDFVVIK